MGLLTTCPSCGLESNEVRCPRCNTPKLLGCTGSCTVCKSRCKTPLEGQRPSDSARDDAEHPGTPLQR